MQKEKTNTGVNNSSAVMTFEFSESRQPVRNVLVENKPWFVAKDVCEVLGLQNPRQHVAKLDEDEKGVYKIYPLKGKGGLQETNIISESGLYALILRSNKPYAKTFRKWITSEVIPSILKKGYYGSTKPQTGDYYDARNIPFQTEEINGVPVRVVEVEGNVWVSINDMNRVIRSSTSSNQLAKKLNTIEELAIKIWIFGNTQPAWFTCNKGLQLMLSGSRANRGGDVKFQLMGGH